MNTSTATIDSKVTSYQDPIGLPQKLFRLFMFILLIGAIASLMYWANTLEPVSNFLDQYGNWWGEALWVITFLLYIILHKSTSQPRLDFVVSDSRRIMPIAELIKNEETFLYADCAVLSRNIYVQGDSVESTPYTTFFANKSDPNGRTEDLDYRIETDWELIKRVGDPNGKKLMIELYRHEKQKVYNQSDEERVTYAFVFRGTVGLNSWIANAHWLFKWLPYQDQYDQIKYIVPEMIEQEIYTRHPGITNRFHLPFNIIATGHSLGGGLAQHACYIRREIKTAYVFNSSPVTGFTDQSKEERKKYAEGVRIHRLYERGEVLENFRFFMKIVYLFKATPNKDPFISEHRIDFEDAGFIAEHGMLPIALSLSYLKENVAKLEGTENDDIMSNGKYKLIREMLYGTAANEAKSDAMFDDVNRYIRNKRK